MTTSDPSPHIGELNEKPLHAALKAWYAQPGDRLEVTVAGFVVDIVRGDLLIEIQTGGFAGIRAKLHALTDSYPVLLVYPIAREKWIVKLAEDGQRQVSRRKSPKQGALAEVFRELVSFPALLAQPNFCLEVLLIREEEARRYDGARGWRRRGWVTHERRLLQVVGRHRFDTPADLGALLPAELVAPFTTADLAEALDQPRRLAQQMAYCLREMGVLTPVGRRGRAILYNPPRSKDTEKPQP
ncbi:MAG: hypothetical protein KKA73_15725 [Chloroflexi bacterium]|nr:hypothetical protein [Chloroflexota bacterium]MBU1749133.1 hypothetical protein [Chloroflexota bacterium]MBU1877802.1 hypothetical protein [Chloroflexota bacterium]